jgi:hypothetical protein
LVETVVDVRKCRVIIDDHREHITVETTDGYIYLFVVPEAKVSIPRRGLYVVSRSKRPSGR